MAFFSPGPGYLIGHGARTTAKASATETGFGLLTLGAEATFLLWLLLNPITVGY